MMPLACPALPVNTSPPPVAAAAPVAGTAPAQFLPLLQAATMLAELDPMPLASIISPLRVSRAAVTDTQENLPTQTAADGTLQLPLLLEWLAMVVPPPTPLATDTSALAALPARMNAPAPLQELAATLAGAVLAASPVEVPAPGLLHPAELLTRPPESPAPAVVSTADMTRTPQDPRWAEDFGERVLWAAHRGIGRAEIQLNPLDLGRIEIRLEIEDGQAHVQFSTAQVQAAAAIEQALPRLRELFAQEGLHLAQVQVSAQGSQEHTRQPGGLPRPPSASGAPDESSPAMEPAMRQRRGLLDDYA